MTHDELLAKIDYYFDTDNFHLHKNAIRAVVELHKPDYEMCMTCEMTDYPCPTIQAIESELR
jgi:hypothetical protein